MIYRKIEEKIREHLQSGSDKIMIVQGARQIGKSFIIRHIGKQLFRNYVELNMAEDKEGERLFANVRTTEGFYLQVGATHGDHLGDRTDTLVFIDEIQEYPHLFTLLKFLRQDARFTYIASGSLLGVTMRQTTSVPVGSVVLQDMYPIDFEEFAIANGVGRMALDAMRQRYMNEEGLESGLHDRMMTLFRQYLLVGGLPDAVQTFIDTKNISQVRQVHQDIIRMYGVDAAKYDADHRLKIRRIYEMLPSLMENKKKRVVVKDIEGIKGRRFNDYADEFEYLVSSGIALDVRAISNPRFPLIESTEKNLLKLYMNDVGLLTSLLYRNNITPVVNDECGINLGAVYESVVAQELKAHDHSLFYYDNKDRGEVDFLTDDYDRLSVLPIEVKSGKDYTRHSALTRMSQTPDYAIVRGIVFANTSTVSHRGNITYMPIYYVMFV